VKAAVAGVVLLFALSPTLLLIVLSIGDPGYREVLAKERQIELLWRSVWISGLATILALVWGAIVARGIRSVRGAAAAALETLALLPLLLPSVVVVMGWVFFTGPNGPLAAVFGGPLDLFRPAWASVTMSMCYFPCVTILMLQAHRSVDPSWTTVARMHAGWWRTTWFVARPLYSPYLATAALLVFLLSFGDYGIPWALSVNVYPVEIFAQLSARYDIGRAIAYSTPPVAIAILLVVARHLLFPRVPESVGHRSKSLERPAGRGWLIGAIAILTVANVMPLAMLIRTTGTVATLSEALTIAGDNALHSLTVSLHATWMLLLGGATIALAIRGLHRRWHSAASIAVMLPLVIPGVAVGLGLVILYNKGWIPKSLFYGEGILAIGIFCRLISFPTLVLAAAYSAVRPRMVQAARLAGVPAIRSFWGVTFPLALPGELAAALLAFLFAMGELGASAMVNPPGMMTLSMRISSLLHFGEDRIVAALCLTLSGLILIVFLFGLILLNRKVELNLDAHRA
jgi:iron(III) transport system permease protein